MPQIYGMTSSSFSPWPNSCSNGWLHCPHRFVLTANKNNPLLCRHRLCYSYSKSHSTPCTSRLHSPNVLIAFLKHIVPPGFDNSPSATRDGRTRLGNTCRRHLHQLCRGHLPIATAVQELLRLALYKRPGRLVHRDGRNCACIRQLHIFRFQGEIGRTKLRYMHSSAGRNWTVIQKQYPRARGYHLFKAHVANAEIPQPWSKTTSGYIMSYVKNL